MARALLVNTSEVSSAPPKMLTNIEDPEVTEKQMVIAEKLAPVSGSPILTNVWSVDKNKPAPRLLDFSGDSKVRKNIQSLSKEDKDYVALVSNNIDRAKIELERVMISKEKEDKYLQMIEETKKK